MFNPENKLVACDDCPWAGSASDLWEIHNAEARVDAGGVVPAGECPDCGALAYTTEKTSAKIPPDFNVVDHGSLCVLTPTTDAAEDWAAEHLPADAQGWGLTGIVVAPRFMQDIILGIADAGLTIDEEAQ